MVVGGGGTRGKRGEEGEGGGGAGQEKGNPSSNPGMVKFTHFSPKKNPFSGFFFFSKLTSNSFVKF